ncbi:hypothetical protein CDAR_106191 [Caerostris darwini]|uniref:Uncharacterized protein n=1 Tax=Caerostris darwini TaxID=1538125 RepID=A0AAV4NUW9_9ARAC|nr:hypothetical protein CDAR_106191 [Caerostris darwini]
MWFMHDGTTIYFSIKWGNHRHARYAGMMIQDIAPAAWPPISLDLQFLLGPNTLFNPTGVLSHWLQFTILFYNTQMETLEERISTCYGLADANAAALASAKP